MGIKTLNKIGREPETVTFRTSLSISVQRRTRMSNDRITVGLFRETQSGPPEQGGPVGAWSENV
jgi:hypothetical protein